MTLRIVVLVLVLATSGAVGAAQVPAQPSSTSTGVIVGQAVDAVTGAPIPEAIVTLSLSVTRMPDLRTEPATPLSRRVMADEDGRFFFTDLPAGNYYFRAHKEGYYDGGYNYERPTSGGSAFALADGQRRADATLRLWKFSTISGTVVDESGEPVVGVTVQALVRMMTGGRPLFSQMLAGGSTTDDRGMFRLSQLVPGHYVVAVPATLATFPAPLLANLAQNPSLRSSMFEVSPEISIAGSPQTQQFGDHVLLTQNRILVPPAPRSPTAMEVYRTMYFPATASPEDATIITLVGGDERHGIDIRLRPVPAVRVSGKLVGQNGPPPPTAIRLLAEPGNLSTGTTINTVTGMSDATGAFTLLGVPSGKYTLKTQTRPVSTDPDFPPPPAMWATMPLTVGATDLSEVNVTLTRVFRIEGRVEYRNTPSHPPPAPGDVLIALRTVFGDPGFVGGSPITSQGTFTATGAGGRYYFRPAVQPFLKPWVLHSVMYNGRDISRTPLDLQSDVAGIVVVLTNTPARLSGTVTDIRKTPTTTSEVVVFPTDPSRWLGYGPAATDFLRARVTSAGTYAFENVPAGEYFVAALTDLESDSEGDWASPSMCQAIARTATRITIGDSEQRSLALTARPVR